MTPPKLLRLLKPSRSKEDKIIKPGKDITVNAMEGDTSPRRSFLTESDEVLEKAKEYLEASEKYLIQEEEEERATCGGRQNSSTARRNFPVGESTNATDSVDGYMGHYTLPKFYRRRGDHKSGSGVERLKEAFAIIQTAEEYLELQIINATKKKKTVTVQAEVHQPPKWAIESVKEEEHGEGESIREEAQDSEDQSQTILDQIIATIQDLGDFINNELASGRAASSSSSLRSFPTPESVIDLSQRSLSCHDCPELEGTEKSLSAAKADLDAAEAYLLSQIKDLNEIIREEDRPSTSRIVDESSNVTKFVENTVNLPRSVDSLDLAYSHESINNLSITVDQAGGSKHVADEAKFRPSCIPKKGDDEHIYESINDIYISNFGSKHVKEVVPSADDRRVWNKTFEQRSLYESIPDLPKMRNQPGGSKDIDEYDRLDRTPLRRHSKVNNLYASIKNLPRNGSIERRGSLNNVDAERDQRVFAPFRRYSNVSNLYESIKEETNESVELNDVEETGKFRRWPPLKRCSKISNLYESIKDLTIEEESETGEEIGLPRTSEFRPVLGPRLKPCNPNRDEIIVISESGAARPPFPILKRPSVKFSPRPQCPEEEKSVSFRDDPETETSPETHPVERFSWDNILRTSNLTHQYLIRWFRSLSGLSRCCIFFGAIYIAFIVLAFMFGQSFGRQSDRSTHG